MGFIGFISPPSNWSYGPTLKPWEVNCHRETSTPQVSWPRDRSMRRRFPPVDDTWKNPVETWWTPSEKFIVVFSPEKEAILEGTFIFQTINFQGISSFSQRWLKVWKSFKRFVSHLSAGSADTWRVGSSQDSFIQVVDNNGCLASPQVLGLWDPFQMAFFWLINGGDPNHGCSSNTGKFPLCSSAFTDKSSWWWALKSCDINMSLQLRNPLEVPIEIPVERKW